jgi:hypothetical protein
MKVTMEYRIKIDDLIPKAKSLAVNKALTDWDMFWLPPPRAILSDKKTHNLSAESR